MTLNKKQTKTIFSKPAFLTWLFISANFFISHQTFAQESNKLNEIEINRTINFDDEDNRDLPTNPFEIVDRIRRANSMNDATNPSEAIDEAIKSFDMIKKENQI